MEGRSIHLTFQDTLESHNVLFYNQLHGSGLKGFLQLKSFPHEKSTNYPLSKNMDDDVVSPLTLIQILIMFGKLQYL
ncbi:hypothetical protein XBP1_1350003 [Xenorhabdus bovienii str. puntauvense]|uniref:Uncharacterized protein n=1 Tax=Xenorhabdus bovienii str. puntauvense TaxID=1398201 RepID=A0A077NBD8_XENBV|nr:hypothetical protein XBP1_1350003 [Xenorhabdus bovienii str. puntauvense]